MDFVLKADDNQSSLLFSCSLLSLAYPRSRGQL